MLKDMNGDGTLGNFYYIGGHVHMKPTLAYRLLGFVGAAILVFLVFLMIGSVLNLKPAQAILDAVIAGRQ